MHKKELAELVGVSLRTFRYWLNEKYFVELKEIGYMKTQKILTPKQVSFLFKKLVITPEEE